MVKCTIIALYFIGWVACSWQMQAYGRNKPNINPFMWAIGSIVLGSIWPCYVVIYNVQHATDVIDAWGNGKPTP